MKTSSKIKEIEQKKSRVAALTNIFQRLTGHANGVEHCPLYSLDVCATAGFSPPDGVSDTATAVANTDVVIRVSPDAEVAVASADSKYPANLAKGLDYIRAAKFKLLTRTNSAKELPDPAFVDYKTQVYCALTDIAFKAYAEICVKAVYCGYSLYALIGAFTDLETYDEIVSCTHQSVMCSKERDTAVFKAAINEKNIELQGKMIEAGQQLATISSGVLPLYVQLGDEKLDGERVSVTNHGQDKLNHGCFLFMEQVMQECEWDGFPVWDEESQSVIREDATDTEDATMTIPPNIEATHLASTADNCLNLGKSSTQRAALLRFCQSVDSSSSSQYTPASYTPTFLFQKPAGHGQVWLDFKVASLLYMLTYTHAHGRGITLDEMFWHIVRSGAASSTGYFPKATDKPYKAAFNHLLYAVSVLFDAEAASFDSEELWTSFKVSCEKANANRQKPNLHHAVWYMFELMRARGAGWLSLTVNVDTAAPCMAPYLPFVEDDCSAKIKDAVIVLASSEPSVELTCKYIVKHGNLHQSLGTVCGTAATYKIFGSIYATRVRNAVRQAAARFTHPQSQDATAGSILWAAYESLPISFCSTVWLIASDSFRSSWGKPLLPGFATHPWCELVFYELNRIVPPDTTTTDMFEVWPEMMGSEDRFSVYRCGPNVMLCKYPLLGCSEFELCEDVYLNIKSVTLSEEKYLVVLLSIPDGAPINPNEPFDENYICQTYTNSDGRAAGFILSAEVRKRAACSLSIEQDVMCHRFFNQSLKPKISATGKTPLLLSTVASAGVTFIDVSPGQMEFLVVIALMAPVALPDGTCVVFFFYLAFESSDKYMKVLTVQPVPADEVIRVVDATANMEVRRAQLRDYVMGSLFSEAVQWSSSYKKDTPSSNNRKLLLSLKPGVWQAVLKCGNPRLYGTFVDGDSTVLGLLVHLTRRLGVTESQLYEGVLQCGSAWRSLWGIRLDQDDESLWTFIKTKEEDLTVTATKYAVAEAGHRRLTEECERLTQARLGYAESLLDLQLLSDTDNIVDKTELVVNISSLDTLKQRGNNLQSTAKRLKK